MDCEERFVDLKKEEDSYFDCKNKQQKKMKVLISRIQVIFSFLNNIDKLSSILYTQTTYSTHVLSVQND